MGQSGVKADLLDNLVPNPESYTIDSILFIWSRGFVIIPYNSNYYIFDSPSRDNLCQSSENGYSISLQFFAIEHALNFIIPTYLINNQLQNVCKTSIFLKVEKLTKGSVIRKLRPAYNIFYCVNNERIQMPCSNLKK